MPASFIVIGSVSSFNFLAIIFEYQSKKRETKSMRNLIKVMKLILRPKNFFHIGMEISFEKSNTPHRYACKKNVGFVRRVT